MEAWQFFMGALVMLLGAGLVFLVKWLTGNIREE